MSRTQVGLSVVLPVTLGACTDSPGETPVQSASVPVQAWDPPAGRRWQGNDNVVVAVPERWRTETSPCALPDGDVVWFVGSLSLRVHCAGVPTTGASSVVVSRHDLLGSGVRLAKRATRNGVAIRHNGTRCQIERVAVCTTLVVAREADAAFQVTFRGPGARAAMALVRDSITRLPRGYVTVPLVDYGD